MKNKSSPNKFLSETYLINEDGSVCKILTSFKSKIVFKSLGKMSLLESSVNFRVQIQEVLNQKPV